MNHEKEPIKPFEIDPRVTIKINFDLACQLAELIFSSKVDNKALLALAHRLKNLEEREG